ncbi:MAG: hypothetical protein ACE5NG_19905 [bacterium]
MKETRNMLNILSVISLLCMIFIDAACVPQETEDKKMERLRRALKEVRFVAYGPSQYNPLPQEFMPANELTILTDLQILRPYFDGLILYSCNSAHGLEKIVPIAATLKYRAVIMGIWNITSEDEIATAIRLAKEYPLLIVAIIVGNEGILRGPRGGYDYPTLEAAIKKVREALPNVALSTSEPIIDYGDEDLRRITDFHAPNIHPWFAGTERRRNYRAAVDWVKSWVKSLQKVSDKSILVHETGLPSGPEPYASPELQKNFWETLFAEMPNTESCGIAFFEGFDAGEWKMKTNPSDISEVEIHWGAFTNDRNPKPIVKVLPKVK